MAAPVWILTFGSTTAHLFLGRVAQFNAPGLAEQCNVEDLPRVTGSRLLGRIPMGAGALPRQEFVASAPSWLDFA